MLGKFVVLCKRELASCSYHCLYLSIFLSLQSNFLLQISLLLWEPESSNFLYTLRVAKYIVGRKTKMLRFIFYILFPFFRSHSNVIHREICVTDFSGTVLYYLGFWNLVQMLGKFVVLCKRESASCSYHFLNLSIFLSLQSNFLLQISLLLWEPESSNFLYTLRVAKYIVGRKTKMLRYIFTFSFHFSISRSNVIHLGNLCQRFLRNYCP